MLSRRVPYCGFHQEFCPAARQLCRVHGGVLARLMMASVAFRLHSSMGHSTSVLLVCHYSVIAPIFTLPTSGGGDKRREPRMSRRWSAASYGRLRPWILL